MWAMRELAVESLLGDAPWALLREYLQLTRKKWPKLNAKLMCCPSVASNKACFMTEHKSLADVEQWSKAYWADEDIKNLLKRQHQLAKENGGREVFSSYRDIFWYDMSDEEPK